MLNRSKRSKVITYVGVIYKRIFISCLSIILVEVHKTNEVLTNLQKLLISWLILIRSAQTIGKVVSEIESCLST